MPYFHSSDIYTTQDSRTRFIRLLPHRAVTFSNQEVCKAKALGPITFIAPLPTSPVDVQTAEPTLGDTSIIVSQ